MLFNGLLYVFCNLQYIVLYVCTYYGLRKHSFYLKYLLSEVNSLATNTLRVGRTDDPTTPITITPTISQPVKLECQRDSMYKQWFTDDSVTVTPTNGELTNTPGPIRTLSISSFSPSHAGTYTCKVNRFGPTPTVYSVVVSKYNVLFMSIKLHLNESSESNKYLATSIIVIYIPIFPYI